VIPAVIESPSPPPEVPPQPQIMEHPVEINIILPPESPAEPERTPEPTQETTTLPPEPEATQTSTEPESSNEPIGKKPKPYDPLSY
jgi:hypothetical protein